ncbi:MAG: hypothetical protein Q8Q54_08995 [Methylococcales bacterium]|nr:hypothetical protein [Methylococcales bacterium]
MLHTLTYELDLPQSRTIQLKLPDTIKTGKHHIVLVIDEKEDQTDDFQQLLNATKGLWQQGDGLAYQQALRNEWE